MQSGLLAAFTTAPYGGYSGNPIVSALGNSVMAGVRSSLSGGTFREGFVQSLKYAAITYVVATIAAQTSSAQTGGKFENGATTDAQEVATVTGSRSDSNEYCVRTASGDESMANSQITAQQNANQEFLATPEMISAAIATEDDFFRGNRLIPGPNGGEPYRYMTSGLQIIKPEYLCATGDTASVLIPRSAIADIHGHFNYRGNELPGVGDGVTNGRVRFYWTPSKALRVVEMRNVNGQFLQMVRTVFGGTELMNQAASQWRAGMSDADRIRIEKSGR
jgi:hypothetical protein